MNIFYLHNYSVLENARYHCDKHVVKMVTEYCQILSTVMHKKSIDDPPYKPTHVNHPCTLWACENWYNFNWLVEQFDALCQEYTHRYKKIHACQKFLPIFEKASNDMPDDQPDVLTQLPQCVDEDCKFSHYLDNRDTAIAYRLYYIKHKNHFATWKNRPVPDWYEYGLESHKSGNQKKLMEAVSYGL